MEKAILTKEEKVFNLFSHRLYDLKKDELNILQEKIRNLVFKLKKIPNPLKDYDTYKYHVQYVHALSVKNEDSRSLSIRIHDGIPYRYDKEEIEVSDKKLFELVKKCHKIEDFTFQARVYWTKTKNPEVFLAEYPQFTELMQYCINKVEEFYR